MTPKLLNSLQSNWSNIIGKLAKLRILNWIRKITCFLNFGFVLLLSFVDKWREESVQQLWNKSDMLYRKTKLQWSNLNNTSWKRQLKILGYNNNNKANICERKAEKQGIWVPWLSFVLLSECRTNRLQHLFAHAFWRRQGVEAGGGLFGRVHVHVLDARQNEDEHARLLSRPIQSHVVSRRPRSDAPVYDESVGK